MPPSLDPSTLRGFGAVLREARVSRGWSQKKVADQVNARCGVDSVTANDVYRWEKEIRTPDVYLEDVAAVLELDVDDFLVLTRGAGRPAQKAVTHFVHPITLDAGEMLEAAPTTEKARAEFDDLLEDDMWRRSFLKGAAGAGVAAAGVSAATGIGGREKLEAHRALRAAHGRLDNLSGAATIYSPAVAHHQEIMTWLMATRSAAERRHVQALAADTGGFIGFLQADLGLADAAFTSYREAAQHARQANDISCCANLVGQASRVLADHGDYAGARNLVDRALSIAGTQAHPAVRCWLHAVRAHHHAGLDAAPEARTDLRTAWRILEDVQDGEVPTYIGYLSESEINKWQGHVMWRLGRRNPAYLDAGQTALDAARATWPATSVRGAAEVLTSSARVHAARGARDIAIAYATQAVGVATTTRSARNQQSALAALDVAQQA
ncbi:helix-turn-helix domain-containing protein [Streptomyces violaceusniger]|uniref:HTH cro/C1-type domain-containing protein n=1 Tax=Streptomyces violaceusniger (strain Tu 4113) TaxID=653045 RepID=G2PHV5_STRV4|nr:helix-turn-helix transcriptional regulator [Streptomyces violaceusniger]AEM88906.1 hypothetical protein Strvi_0130 [Streptomyces violaceusniger Tu 4113]